jgi:hypothetical protein
MVGPASGWRRGAGDESDSNDRDAVLQPRRYGARETFGTGRRPSVYKHDQASRRR